MKKEFALTNILFYIVIANYLTAEVFGKTFTTFLLGVLTGEGFLVSSCSTVLPV